MNGESMPDFLVDRGNRKECLAMNRSFSKGMSYGVALGLLMAVLVLNMVGDVWPVTSVLGCFADPTGHAVSPVAHF